MLVSNAASSVFGKGSGVSPVTRPSCPVAGGSARVGRSARGHAAARANRRSKHAWLQVKHSAAGSSAAEVQVSVGLRTDKRSVKTRLPAEVATGAICHGMQACLSPQGGLLAGNPGYESLF